MKTAILILLLVFYAAVVGVPLWIGLRTLLLLRAARADGVSVSFIDIVGMSMRRAPVRRIIAAARRASTAGLEVRVHQLEVQFLAGGDPELCVEALIAARERDQTVDWATISVIDLAGRDPLAAAKAGANLSRLLGSEEYKAKFLRADRAVV